MLGNLLPLEFSLALAAAFVEPHITFGALEQSQISIHRQKRLQQ